MRRRFLVCLELLILTLLSIFFITETYQRRPGQLTLVRGYPAAIANLQKMEKPRTVFILGGPGAGKGTQCTLISDEFGIPHISAGECLREEQKNPTSPYCSLIDNCMRNGTIVPVRITLTLLLRKMLLKGFRGFFLIDGFPRNLDNLSGWLSMTSSGNIVREISRVAFEFSQDEELQRQCEIVMRRLAQKPLASVAPAEVREVKELSAQELEHLPLGQETCGIVPDMVLFLDCDQETMVGRIHKRGETSGRTDDNEESLRKRFVVYQECTVPIVEAFRKENCARIVDANKSVEEVWCDVKALFERTRNVQAAALAEM